VSTRATSHDHGEGVDTPVGFGPEPCLGTIWEIEELKRLARAELERLGPSAPASLREVLAGLLEDATA
jgi:hypothetical protein